MRALVRWSLSEGSGSEHLDAGGFSGVSVKFRSRIFGRWKSQSVITWAREVSAKARGVSTLAREVPECEHLGAGESHRVPQHSFRKRSSQRSAEDQVELLAKESAKQQVNR